MTKWSFTLERCYWYPAAKIEFGKLRKVFGIYGVDWLSWSCAATLHWVCNKPSSNELKLYSLPVPVLSSVGVESIESLTCEKLLWLLDCSSVGIYDSGASERYGVNLGSAR